MTSAFRMRRSEYVFGRPRGRLTGADGHGRWSMSRTRLTSKLVWRSISVPPQCGCVVTEILRGQPCCGDAERGCFIYDHVSPKRWVVERTFAWLGRCRRNSKDYERRTDSSESMLRVSAIHLMLKRLKPSNV